MDFEIAEALAAIEYAPLVTVPLGIDPAESAVRIEGFGFLVSREEALGLLGCLFMSRLFPSRAPDGRELLHCMVGGARWPEAIDEPDDRLVEGLASDLERTLGIRGATDPLAITRSARAVPQPGRDHVARIAWVREQLRETPGLVLAGGYLDGVGVSASLVSGVSAAAELLALQR
jgi:oxygen-dependent protoporphyrinogen oxidase